MIPYGKHNINQSDLDAVLETLQSDFLTQGARVDQFEQALAEYCGAKFALALSSATAGLHLACLALELDAKSELWTSPNTFVASANSALYCGAKVDFVDIDSSTFNMDVAILKEKLAGAGKIPHVVMPVHFGGQSCDMGRIAELKEKYRFRVIEDASHAIGGRYGGLPVGSCKYSDCCVFSFHPVKIITTGEGGALLTNNEELYRQAKRLRMHGITREPSEMENYHGPWYYEQHELGFNYRITDFQCALGLSQLKRLDEIVERRNALADRYDRELEGLNLQRPGRMNSTYSSFHLYVVQLGSRGRPVDRLKVFNDLRKAGVGVNVHYIPVHLQPYYQNLGFKAGDFPRAEQYYRVALTLPMYPDLSYDQQDFVIEHLKISLDSIN